MSNALALAAIVASATAIWILYLYRKRRLKEDHAILWLFVCVGIVVLSTWWDVLLTINRLVQAEDPSNLVQAAFIAFLLMISIYYSVRISELTEQNKKLAQEMALQKARLNGHPAEKEIKQPYEFAEIKTESTHAKPKRDTGN